MATTNTKKASPKTPQVTPKVLDDIEAASQPVIEAAAAHGLSARVYAAPAGWNSRGTNSVTLSAGLAKQLDKLAETDGVERDYLVEQLLHRALDQRSTAPVATPPATPKPAEKHAGEHYPVQGETDEFGVTWGKRVEGGSDD